MARHYVPEGQMVWISFNPQIGRRPEFRDRTSLHWRQ